MGTISDLRFLGAARMRRRSLAANAPDARPDQQVPTAAVVRPRPGIAPHLPRNDGGPCRERSARELPAQVHQPGSLEDLADADVFRVDDTFYYSASTIHYSPGAPILRSFELVNWEYAGHSVPVLDFSEKYDFEGGNAYVKGISRWRRC
jgi:hypothetical protein